MTGLRSALRECLSPATFSRAGRTGHPLSSLSRSTPPAAEGGDSWAALLRVRGHVCLPGGGPVPRHTPLCVRAVAGPPSQSWQEGARPSAPLGSASPEPHGSPCRRFVHTRPSRCMVTWELRSEPSDVGVGAPACVARTLAHRRPRPTCRSGSTAPGAGRPVRQAHCVSRSRVSASSWAKSSLSPWSPVTRTN